MKKIFIVLTTMFAIPLLVFADEPTECIMSYKVTTTKSATIYKGSFGSSDFNPQSTAITMAEGTTLDIVNEVVYNGKVYLGFSVNEMDGNFSLKALEEDYVGGFAAFGCGDYDAYYVLLSDVKFISMNMKDSYFYKDDKEPYESKKYEVLTNNVVLHTEPSTYAPTVDGITKLPKGFEFTCSKENELFCQTTYQGKTGWVYVGSMPKEEHAFAKLNSEELYMIADRDENVYSDMTLTKKIGTIPEMRIYKIIGISTSGSKRIAKIKYDNIEGYIDLYDKCWETLTNVYANEEMYLYKDFDMVEGKYVLADKITIEAGSNLEEVTFVCTNDKLMVVKYNGEYYYTGNNRSIISEKTNDDKVITNQDNVEKNNNSQNSFLQENIIYIVAGLSLIVIVLIVIITVIVKKNRKLKNNLNA